MRVAMEMFGEVQGPAGGPALEVKLSAASSI